MIRYQPDYQPTIEYTSIEFLIQNSYTAASVEWTIIDFAQTIRLNLLALTSTSTVV